MRTLLAAVLVVVLVVGELLISRADVVAQVYGNDNNVAMMDTCLPGDPGYSAATGGCQLKPHQGDVPAAEFGALLTSPFITGLVGHPSWRNEPSHLTTNATKAIRVTNNGGRAHTFTKVAAFGGGLVGGFNIAMTRAPECPANPGLVTDAVAPGGAGQISGLAPGLHKFQCCFHPWMRATIRIE